MNRHLPKLSKQFTQLRVIQQATFVCLLLLHSALHSVQAQPQLAIDNAQRIVSLAPHLTEMAYSAGAGDKLVGVVNYSDYPQEAQQLPIIGSYNALNLEAIIQLQPDLILSWRSGNRLQDFERLQSLQTQLGFVLWESEVTHLEQIPTIIESIGAMAGTSKIADKTAQTLRQQLHDLTQKYSSALPVKTFYQIWKTPLITVGKSQFINQGIERCGGKNIFEDLGKLTGNVAIETILVRNPEIILLGGAPEIQQDWLTSWQRYSQIEAVKNQQVILLNSDLYQRPTERFIDSLEALCQIIDQARQAKP